MDRGRYLNKKTGALDPIEAVSLQQQALFCVVLMLPAVRTLYHVAFCVDLSCAQAIAAPRDSMSWINAVPVHADERSWNDSEGGRTKRLATWVWRRTIRSLQRSGMTRCGVLCRIILCYEADVQRQQLENVMKKANCTLLEASEALEKVGGAAEESSERLK